MAHRSTCQKLSMPRELRQRRAHPCRPPRGLRIALRNYPRNTPTTPVEQAKRATQRSQRPPRQPFSKASTPPQRQQVAEPIRPTLRLETCCTRAEIWSWRFGRSAYIVGLTHLPHVAGGGNFCDYRRLDSRTLSTGIFNPAIRLTDRLHVDASASRHNAASISPNGTNAFEDSRTISTSSLENEISNLTNHFSKT